MKAFKTINKVTIKDQVYEIIRGRIVTMAYLPDSKINISSLATEFSVSNTPIREALGMLHKDGMVSFSADSGYKVFSLEDEMILPMQQVMSLMMIGGYELCQAQGLTDKLIRDLETQMGKQGALLKNGTPLDIAYAAIRFDAMFFKVLHNEVIETIYHRVAYKLALIVYYDYQHNKTDLRRAFEEHKKILSAVKADDRPLVIRLINEHYSRKIHFA
jgi:DNA-binding GntR family transcriptional regulator